MNLTDLCQKMNKYKTQTEGNKDITSEMFLNGSPSAVCKISTLCIEQKCLYNVNKSKSSRNMGLLMCRIFSPDFVQYQSSSSPYLA